MITKPDIVDLLKKSDNRYELVNIISKRARQINLGDDPKIETEDKSEVTIASQEFSEDKFGILDADYIEENKENQQLEESEEKEIEAEKE